uniref:Major facilitator superfamily (MFS) profile domain-containing protein n=1 Tax=Rhodosorus marinus TaxID=101924 RepID=A0A7S0BK80_9RHOD|mmetsp:Transcript_19638/g.28580  ORF Transcript_19638/g.28580 Transcript_19638/m.28580 type:complete len:388 (+) Transcript_19638:95-1258(+)
MAWFTSFCTAAFVPLLYGMEVGATSNVLKMFQGMTENGINSWEADVTGMKLSAVAWGALIGAISGTLTAIQIADRLGRKKELVSAALFLVIGSMLSSIAESFSSFVLGRALFGVGEGIGMHAALLYTGEIVPAPWRGFCGGSIEVVWVLGMFLANLLGMMKNSSWRESYVLLTVVSTPFLAACFILPESPRWIILNRGSGGLAEAASTFRKLGSSEQESMDMCNHILDSLQKDDEEGAVNNVNKGQSRKALIVGLLLVLFQQLTGQPTILYHMGEIFYRAGVGEGGPVVVTAVKTVATVVAVSQVENFGRRPLLLTGTSIMGISLLFLSVAYSVQPPFFQHLVILLFTTYVVGYQTGFGPVTWLLVSRIPFRYVIENHFLCITSCSP